MEKLWEILKNNLPSVVAGLMMGIGITFLPYSVLWADVMLKMNNDQMFFLGVIWHIGCIMLILTGAAWYATRGNRLKDGFRVVK